MSQHAFAMAATRPIPKDPLDPWVRMQLLLHATTRRWRLRRYAQEADKVLALLPEFAHWEDTRLDQALAVKRALIARRRLGHDRDEHIQLLALLAELARRTLQQTPYRVQVMAILALYDGFLVQVAPGEGKTLTLGLLAVLRGWEPLPCHVITANDYLAQRDADLLEPLFCRAGVSVAAIGADDTPEQKRDAYAADVVYATAKQLVADHLIDRVRFGGAVDRLGLSMRTLMGHSTPLLMQRGLGHAIVDEADHILIDEAVTPMIISEPEANPVLREAVLAAQELVVQLHRGRHYQLDVGHRDVRWLAAGEDLLAEQAPALPPLWRGRQRREDLLAKAVLARDYFHEDQHYVLSDDQVVIVDEGTGRSMPGRSWSYGLHQAIEAKAGVTLSDPSRTMARLSFQNFFKLYARLCGASGTLHNTDYELCFNYRVFTLPIPPRRASQMHVHPWVIEANKATRLERVVDRVVALHRQGRAVLIGTRSVSDSEAVADALAVEGVECQLLNAKNPAAEAEVIAQAGAPGRVTVATNMAGRGTDIKLEAEVLAQGGLCVVMFEAHESARIDWQLFGRSARQGQPGEVFPHASLEDELCTRYLPLPAWLTRFSLPPAWFTGFSRQPAWFTLIGAPLLRFAQQRAARRAFRQRRLLNRATRESRERLTFTNPN